MLRDLLYEALVAALARPARLALTATGTLLGIGALVATIGLVTSAGAQIVSRFDELAATEVVVFPAPTNAGPVESSLPFDAEARIGRLNGVVGAGTLTEAGEATVGATRALDPLTTASPAVQVMAASPGLPAAVRGTISDGRWFDIGHSLRGDRVAVLGRDLAERLAIGDLSRQPAVFLDDRPYVVIGLLSGVERQPELLTAVIIPDGTAAADFAMTAPASVHIETEIGAARSVANSAPFALVPQDAKSVAVRLAPEPTATRANVASDVRLLLLVLGAVSLVIGAVGIANTTLVSVLERTGEIGLRRCLGARRGHIAAQFLIEAGAVGLLGGVFGASLGVLVTVSISHLQAWTPVMPPWLPPTAAALGAAVGLTAGAYPAWRASTTAPIIALRADT